MGREARVGDPAQRPEGVIAGSVMWGWAGGVSLSHQLKSKYVAVSSDGCSYTCHYDRLVVVLC